MWFMIRKLQKTDINRVADIWLDTNLKAHDFIPAKYWKTSFFPDTLVCGRYLPDTRITEG